MNAVSLQEDHHGKNVEDQQIYQLMNKKLYSPVYLSGKKMEDKATNSPHCSQLSSLMETPRSQLTDLMAPLQPTSISKNNHISGKDVVDQMH